MPKDRLNDAQAEKFARRILEVADDKFDDWLRPVLAAFARDGLNSIRDLIAEKPAGVDWKNPAAESRYEFDWDWQAYDAGGGDSFVERWVSLAKLLKESDWSSTPEALYWAVIFAVFRKIAPPMALAKRGGILYLIEAAARVIEEQPVAERDSIIAQYCSPREAGPVVSGSFVLDGGDAYEVALSLSFRPYVVDEDIRKVYYPVVATLAFQDETGGAVPYPIDQDGDTRQLFDALEEAIKAAGGGKDFGSLILDVVRMCRNEPIGSSDPPLQAPSPQTSGVPGPYVPVLDRPTIRDPRVGRMVHQLTGIHLPRKWGQVRRFEDLAAERIQFYQAELGEDAFKKVAGRKPLLLRDSRHNAVRLSEQEEDSLIASLNGKPFRRVIRGDDGVQREFLVKRIQTDAGKLEVKLSWYNQAWTLSGEQCDRVQAELGAVVRQQSGRLFDDLTPEEQDELDGRLRMMESIRDGRIVMECILDAFGMHGTNPVEIPARELYVWLGCEADTHRLRRVRGCLMALSEIRFAFTADSEAGQYQGQGAFLAEFSMVAAGPGRHGEGTFRLQIADSFVGCLKIFGSQGAQIRDPETLLKIERFDWNKPLTSEQRKQINQTPYLKGASGITHLLAVAHGFTARQKSLLRWVSENITTGKDRTRKGRESVRVDPKSKNADKPRVYGGEFCSFLTDGRSFHGALGRFKHNAEAGWTLYGKSQGKSSGLMHALGYVVPSGKGRLTAIKQIVRDLGTVVGQAMGGVVAARFKQKWMKPEDALKLLDEPTLGKQVTWFLFPADDWQSRLRETFNAYQAERFERGDTHYRVRATDDYATYNRFCNAREGIHFDTAGSDGPEELPLHLRMKDRRKTDRLSQGALGQMFGVSAMAVSTWERGPARPGEQSTGKAIPGELVPFILRWIETGRPMSSEELGARRTSKSGSSKAV